MKNIKKKENHEKINPLFKDVKEHNKYLLSLMGIFVLLLTGIISYNFTNTSHAKWHDTKSSNNILKLGVKKKDYALEFAQANVGQNGLELVTHEIDDTLQVDSKFATEYRYRGGDSVVKNYVTFNNEVWRIIGVIPTEDTNGNVENRFKIIRAKSIGEYNWNDERSVDWTVSTLNIYLNTNYYNALSSEVKSMIGTTKYYLGGYSNSNITTDVMWQYERKNKPNSVDYYTSYPVIQCDENKRIALMYVSDYGYAASKLCEKVLYYYDNDFNCNTTNNWLNDDEYYNEWLLAREHSGVESAFYVEGNKVDATDNMVNYNKFAIRPVLYLSSKVKISSGTGTSSDPYQLSL